MRRLVVLGGWEINIISSSSSTLLGGKCFTFSTTVRCNVTTFLSLHVHPFIAGPLPTLEYRIFQQRAAAVATKSANWFAASRDDVNVVRPTNAAPWFLPRVRALFGVQQPCWAVNGWFGLEGLRRCARAFSLLVSVRWDRVDRPIAVWGLSRGQFRYRWDCRRWGRSRSCTARSQIRSKSRDMITLDKLLNKN